MNPEIALIGMEHGHAKEIARLLNDAEVHRYLSGIIPFPYTEADARSFITAVLEPGSPFKSMTVTYRGRIAGIAGYQSAGPDKEHVAVAGYWFGREFWGLGIATQALRLVIGMAFSDPRIMRIEASAFSPNAASCRVMEKCGMKHEATLEKALSKDGVLYDETVYRLLRSEYRACSL